MKNIDVKELIGAMDELEKERGISKAYLIESLEAALVTAYKKNFGKSPRDFNTIKYADGNF